MMKFPSRSVAAPLEVPSTRTEAPMSGSLVFASTMVPLIVPVCAKPADREKRKRVISDNRKYLFIEFICRNNLYYLIESTIIFSRQRSDINVTEPLRIHYVIVKIKANKKRGFRPR